MASGGTFKIQSDIKSPMLVKVTLSFLLLSIAVWAGLGASDRMYAKSIPRLADEDFEQAIINNKWEQGGSPFLLESLADRAFRLEKPDYSFAENALKRALIIEPRNSVLYTKLAFSLANQTKTDVRNKEIVSALNTSYELMPYAKRAFSYWRVNFVLKSNLNLPQNIIDYAKREAKLYNFRRFME